MKTYSIEKQIVSLEDEEISDLDDARRVLWKLYNIMTCAGKNCIGSHGNLYATSDEINRCINLLDDLSNDEHPKDWLEIWKPPKKDA